MSLMNRGTRRSERPLGGDEPLPREILGNKQAERMALLLKAQTDVGGLWSVENPRGSYLFSAPPILDLQHYANAETVHFDQCSYGLRLPGDLDYHYVKKGTTILTNIRDLHCLSSSCPGLSDTHRHTWCIGTGTYHGKTYKRSAAAAHYPVKLCEAWARGVARAVGLTPGA